MSVFKLNAHTVATPETSWSRSTAAERKTVNRFCFFHINMWKNPTRNRSANMCWSMCPSPSYNNVISFPRCQHPDTLRWADSVDFVRENNFPLSFESGCLRWQVQGWVNIFSKTYFYGLWPVLMSNRKREISFIQRVDKPPTICPLVNNRIRTNEKMNICLDNPIDRKSPQKHFFPPIWVRLPGVCMFSKILKRSQEEANNQSQEEFDSHLPQKDLL